MTPSGYQLELRPHPSSPASEVRAISAHVARSASELRVAFRVEGDLSRVRFPERAVSARPKELWRHTCFEVFLAIEGQPAYHEYNFTSSGDWELYAFRAYRDGAPVSDGVSAPLVSSRGTSSEFELEATIDLNRLSTDHRDASLQVGLSAVIETDAGISHWALRHPDGKPDFHNRDGFGLVLAAPRGG